MEYLQNKEFWLEFFQQAISRVNFDVNTRPGIWYGCEGFCLKFRRYETPKTHGKMLYGESSEQSSLVWKYDFDLNFKQNSLVRKYAFDL